jgi:hypothetical protein
MKIPSFRRRRPTKVNTCVNFSDVAIRRVGITLAVLTNDNDGLHADRIPRSRCFLSTRPRVTPSKPGDTTTHLLLLLAWVGLIAGCSTLAERQESGARLVGKPVAELEGAMGVPTRTSEAGAVTFLIYEDRHPETVPGNPFCYGPGPFCDGGGFPPPPPANLVCDTTFTVTNGVVRAFSLRGEGCAY